MGLCGPLWGSYGVLSDSVGTMQGSVGLYGIPWGPVRPYGALWGHSRTPHCPRGGSYGS